MVALKTLIFTIVAPGTLLGIAPLAVSFVSIFRSSSLLIGFLASLYLALQMRILPCSFFAYNFIIHP